MTQRDYYEILGVSRDADDNTIKKAYRKLALKYHPDRNSGDEESEEKFKEAGEAYEVLSNPEKRSRYDRFGHQGVKSSFSGGGFSWDDFSHFGDFDDIFGDIFSAFFGGGRARGGGRTVNRGRNLRIRYSISLEEAFKGKEETISVNKFLKCDTCNGSGAAEGSEVKTCSRCHGRGQIHVVQGFFRMSTPCDVCHGEGKIIENPCPDCHGQGRIRKKVDIDITIPKGIDTGMEMVLRGQGEAGPHGGPNGDLLILFHVEEHPFFKRKGDHIYCEVPVNFGQIALGDTIEIPTLHGPETLKIPPQTQTHEVLKIKNRGMPRNEAAFGDQYVKVIAKTPKKLTPRQKELLSEFSAIEKEKPPEGKGFFERFKESINEMARDMFQ